MKKIIDGKLYNTETAQELGNYWNGCTCGDFNYLAETLYRTKKGRFFLYGSGGAMSKYSQSCGTNSWCGSEDITPLSEDEAREWLETYGSADEYAAVFDAEEA